MSREPQKPPQEVTLEVASLLRENLARRQMSQAQLARSIDMSTSQISRFLRGERAPNLEEYIGLCASLNLHPDLLLAKAIQNVRWRSVYGANDPFATPGEDQYRYSPDSIYPEN